MELNTQHNMKAIEFSEDQLNLKKKTILSRLQHELLKEDVLDDKDIFEVKCLIY